MEVLGTGAEAVVYAHPFFSDRVLKLLKYRHEKDKYDFRRTFYLAKILHALYPNNFPDMYAAGFSFPGENSSFFVYHRVFPEPGYALMMNLRIKRDLPNEPKTPVEIMEIHSQFIKALELHRMRVQQSSFFKILLQAIKQLNIFLDGEEIN